MDGGVDGWWDGWMEVWMDGYCGGWLAGWWCGWVGRRKGGWTNVGESVWMVNLGPSMQTSFLESTP